MIHRSGIPRGRRGRSARVRGFTLVELMVALMVMTVGILGLASTAGIVTRMMSGAVRQTVAANVVQARMELLRNQPCATVASGSATTRGVSESWTVIPAGPNLIRIVDSASFSTMSRRQPIVRAYWSYAPCR